MAFDWTNFFQDMMPPPKNARWDPTYLPQQFVISPGNDGKPVFVGINKFYFATKETAQVIMDKYCAKGKLIEIPFEGAGGPIAATQHELAAAWPNGVVINTGLLASLWSLNVDHPDGADKLCRDAIEARGAVVSSAVPALAKAA